MRPAPRRVLHILGTAQREATGLVRIVRELAGGLDPAHYRLHAWFLEADGPLAQELSAAGAAVRILPFRGVGDPLGALRFWTALRGQHFSIVHQHLGGPTVRWLVRAGTGAPLVSHLHGRVAEAGGASPAAVLSRGADAVTASCRAVADLASAVEPQVIYAGLPALPRCGPGHRQEDRRRVIGAACRLVALKGIVHLLRAVASLRSQVPDLGLEIAGAGPEQGALETETRRLGLTEVVAFLGWQTEVEALMARWDVFALPSLEEGFPIAGLEAMAAGLPVVGTTVGGIPELVEDGTTGYLVRPGDALALADCLRPLLLDQSLRQRMGEAGRLRVQEHFTAERMVGEISEIYDRLLENSS